MLSPEKPSLHKYEELSDLLRKKILPLASGSRLPSVRSLMKRYNLSLQTVNAALKKLEVENLIVTKRGSGIYVSDQRTVKLIVFHRSVHPSNHEDSKEACIRKAVLEAGWYMETRRHEILIRESQLPLSPEPKGCAHLVTQELANLRFGLLNQLIQQSVPVVVLGRETDAFHIDCVTTHDQEILRVLIKHLHSLGHRRLALLVNEPGDYFEIKRRVVYFTEILGLMDMPPGVIIDCHTQPSQKTTAAAYFGLKNYFENLPRGSALPFTALIAVSSTGGIGSLRALYELGIKVPEQCSVCCFDAEEINAFTVPALTDAGTPVALWGDCVVRLLRQRFEGDSSPSIGYKLPVELHVRETASSLESRQAATGRMRRRPLAPATFERPVSV